MRFSNKRTFASLLAALSCVLSSTVSFAQGANKQPIVAVASIDDNAGSGQSKTLTQMLLTAIAATQKFRVMERGQMDVLVQEQQKAKSGLVTSRNGGNVGGFEGADYLIYGTITTLSASKKSDFGATLGMALLSGAVNQNSRPQNCYGGEVTLSLDIRITDGQSGQIKYVKRIDEKKSAGTICGEGVPQTNATELFRSAADKVATGLVTSVYPIRVAAVQEDGSMVINYGEGTVQTNDFVTLFRPGESIVDPDTGRSLGTSEKRLGIAQVIDVQSGFSKIKKAVGFETPAAVRDVARPTTDDDFKAYPDAKLKRK